MQYETILIADVYDRLAVAKHQDYQVDNAREAERMSAMVRVLSTSPRQIAIVPEDKPDVQQLYSRAGFETVPMNGNRPQELNAFMGREMKNMRNGLKNLILATSDPLFGVLATSAANNSTNVQIWSTGTIPSEFVCPDYRVIRLEDLAGDAIVRTPKIAVYLDYENLHISLQRRGIDTTPKAISDAVRAMTSDLGNIVHIDAYADWDELSRNTERNIQRELEMAGVKTHYQISKHGKNSADMVLANDIRTRISRQNGDVDAVDMIVLGSQDRDFSTIVKEVQKDKRIVLLGLSGGTSRDLEKLTEVRYLDKHLAGAQENAGAFSTSDEEFSLLMQIAAYMNCKNYSWVYIDKLATEVVLEGGQGKLRQAIKAGLLKTKTPGETNKLMLNLAHPDAYIARWLVSRIDYLLNKKGMDYVDSNYLVRGMQMDRYLQEQDIFQSWPDGKAILERGRVSGVLATKNQKHPKAPNKTITTWELAGVTTQVTEKTEKESIGRGKIQVAKEDAVAQNHSTYVNAQGGTYIGGNVTVKDGDFLGKDKTVHGSRDNE